MDADVSNELQKRPPTRERNLEKVFWVASAGVLCFVSVLTWTAPLHWCMNLLAELRIQQCTVIVVMLAVAMFRQQGFVAMMMLIALALHAPWLTGGGSAGRFDPNPSTKFGDPAPDLTVTVSNALTKNQRHGEVIADILRASPDVFGVVELSHELSEKMIEHSSHRYPYRVVRPISSYDFGIGLFSKHPLDDVDVFSFDEGIESIAATFSKGQETYRIYVTHPLPPVSHHNFDQRNEHLRLLAEKLREDRASHPDCHFLLIGDLNATPWSPALADLSDGSGLDRAITGIDFTPTHYSGPSWFPFGLVIDHVLISDRLQCVGHRVGGPTGSDHRSVTVEITAAATDQ
ncbi:Endonuclease/Exonuclease/phosphatase family protein [Rubripirellula tenax]|uniref:Endonuclease/Exonuclease/phosphatase family protein n=1 Tax=Rubripirellula tenax TaxID=2528015 RepID=A0A5C6EQ56_9BACT|nr:endonuclease/exonuclease/phosphatase family protein [Rubripirellula tenax]TWU50504.1 Endonuclease/Exonuclease/phosphatase family protein [Rubripirellula tenax]